MRVLIGLLALFPSLGWAAMACQERAEIGKILEDRYQEQVVSRAITNSGQTIVEVFRNLERDTWTIVATDSDRQSCLIASGEGWYNLNVTEEAPVI